VQCTSATREACSLARSAFARTRWTTDAMQESWRVWFQQQLDRQQRSHCLTTVAVTAARPCNKYTGVSMILISICKWAVCREGYSLQARQPQGRLVGAMGLRTMSQSSLSVLLICLLAVTGFFCGTGPEVLMRI
jgi:hypothetical protein